jgi:hypothetical protein
MSHIDELRESIDGRIVEVQNEIAALQAARAALRDGRATSTEAPSPPTVAAQPRRRARRKSGSSQRQVEVLLAGKLEMMLGESEAGLSAVTVSKRAHASYRQVLVLLRELEQTGRVRRSGTSRTSLWRLITDEERIAERAAELARLNASGPT